MSSEDPAEMVQSEHPGGADEGTPEVEEPHTPLRFVNPEDRPPVLKPRFGEVEVDRMLKALVLANMRVKLAKQRLEREGLIVSQSTLRDLKNRHDDRLEDLAAQRAWVAEGQASTYEGLTDELTSLALHTAEQIAARSDWQEMNIASLGKLLTSLMTGAAIATDKARLLRDMPTIITESRDLPALLQALDKYSNVVSVNKDLIEVEVVEEEPAPALPLPESGAA